MSASRMYRMNECAVFVNTSSYYVNYYFNSMESARDLYEINIYVNGKRVESPYISGITTKVIAVALLRIFVG